ncbi:hypothetical protein GLOIN_2v1782827 [Rhizophagus clarus]|uniref:SHSP domain-containing protein n=1 Tax=Rhizophagus clarus TaxID=94130 RepID=A0A8H3MG82_9GLOM|nr:hypothetical protein GLOIN_2v1782827 [Rhizophagus clarus]
MSEMPCPHVCIWTCCFNWYCRSIHGCVVPPPLTLPSESEWMSSLPVYERSTPLFPRGGISSFCTWSVVYYPILPCESDYLPTTNTANKKRICCGKSELSVLISGAIENINSTELELCLQEITLLSFEHIIKKQENGWGHVHFGTHDDASKFFYKMKGKTFTGPNHCEIRFSAAMHFRSKKLVDYHIIETESSDNPSDLSDTECLSSQPKTDDIPHQIVQSVEQSLPKSQYALYDNNKDFYIVKMYTPGVQQKEQVQIDVSCDDRTIAIIAESSIFEENDCTVIENNLQTRFKIDIVFPRMINTDHPIRVDVEHGVTTAMFNIKPNKRKLQIF